MECVGARFTVAGYSHSSFLANIIDGSFSDEKIKDEIKRGSYFNYENFNDPKTRLIFQSLWTNKVFLKNVLEILDIDRKYRDRVINNNIISINKIAYDYYTSGAVDDEIANLLFEIVKLIDYSYIIKLSTIMPIDAAKFITMARFSSFDEREAITRFNSLIYNIGIDFSVKDIIYIYTTFFSVKFSRLFTITMTTPEEKFNTRTSKKVYDMMSLALLSILQSMTSSDIYKVLNDYANHMSLTSGGKCRFSMRGLSEDYNRINIILEELSSNGIFIP